MNARCMFPEFLGAPTQGLAKGLLAIKGAIFLF